MSELRLLSVVMPVYNARPYLDASIASILEQTYADFEFVIGDDGSTDGSRAVLRAWADRDPRIRLLESNARRGPAASSNWVVGRSQGRLVARMDADDVSHRDRLRRQLDVLARHPEIDLVGSLWDTIDADGRRVRRSDRWRLARRSAFAPFAHPSVMFRREAFENAGGYRHRCEFWEDTDLYLRMAARGRIAVLADVLLRVRSTPSGVRLGPDRERIEDAYDEMFRCLAEWHRRHDYDSFLRDEGRPRRLVPGAFIMLGAAELWAGGRPSVL
ncbi:MAG: glycosyltransferase family 2 protein, partial [Solirubrobacterales bacterium]|nr:glycosyltransferase family 2 protein [Solirubrobacterales bacterium]